MPLSTTAADPSGLSRRDFVKVCSAAAAAVGLPAWAAEKMAEKAAKGQKPSVIWLHFQECTGCTESLLRTSHPDVAELILDLVSLDYHETLAGGGRPPGRGGARRRDEGERRQVRLRHRGRDPDEGRRHLLQDRRARPRSRSLKRRRGEGRARSSRSAPAPRGAASRPPTRTRPARPARRWCSRARRSSRSPAARRTPTTSSAPCCSSRRSARCRRSTTKGRPMFAYGRTIHEHCPRRAHFDAGRFAQQFGDEGHRQG